jgi:hypothetical protein
MSNGRARHLPRSEDKLAAELCEVASILQDWHAEFECIHHDHGDPAKDPMTHVVATLGGGPGAQCTSCHAECVVES